MNCNGKEKGNIPFRSTINGAYVFDSKMVMPMMLNSRIITEARCDMSIPNTRERKIRPTHPGEMLREDFLPDYGLTVSTFAKALGVSRQTVNELLRERRAVSPEMALRLSRLFGNTAEFWLNVQRAVDLWEASRTMKEKIKRINPMRAA
jgi:addiction module HigA family antidote